MANILLLPPSPSPKYLEMLFALISTSDYTYSTRWWIALENGLAIGAGGLDFERVTGAAVLCNIPAPADLQLRLIAERLNFMRGSEKLMLAYTKPHEYITANSLIASGFLTYWPTSQFAGVDKIYWKRQGV